MRTRETGSISPVSRPINYKGDYELGTVYFPNDLVKRQDYYWLYIHPIPTAAGSPTADAEGEYWAKIGSSENPTFDLEGIDISINDIDGLTAKNVQAALEELKDLTTDPVLIASNDILGTVQVGDGILPNPVTGNIELLKSPYLDERAATGPKNIFYVSTNGYDHPDVAVDYKVAANLVKINRTNIINAAFNAITVPPALAGEATTNKCKRDIGFFVDAIIADLGNSTSAPAGFLSNLYATQAAKAYYTLEGVRNISASEITPTKEAFAKVATEVIIKVGNQFASFVNALTSLVNGYLEYGLNWSDAPPLNIGVQRGRYIDGGNLILANKTHIIDSVLDKLQSPPNNYTIPAGDKCRRDLEFIIEAVVKDLQNLSNTFSITIGRNYYGSEGLVISDSGNPSEKQKTITAFIETRQLCMDAIQNKLSNTSDYDSVSGDLNPALFLPNALQHEESECATVASAAHVLFSIVIGYIQNGLGWANAPKQNPGLTRKPLPGQTVETAYKTIKRALKEVKKFPGKECTVRVGSGKYYEDNPLEIPQPKTAVVGDNLRTTTVIPLNHGQDLFKLDSGTYLNYLVFEDNYLGGFGVLDSSNQVNPREMSANATAFKLFPGHTIKDTPNNFKQAADSIDDDRLDIIASISGYSVPDTVKIIDAVIADLRIVGNINVISASVTNNSEKINQIKDAILTSIVAYSSDVKDLVEDLIADLLDSIAPDKTDPEPNTGTLLLVNQEWMQIESINLNDVIIKSRGLFSSNPVGSSFRGSAPTRHISGSKCTQGAKAFRYAAAFKDGVNIFLSPYIQNCSNISVLGRTVLKTDGSGELDDTKTLAGGILVDGGVLAPSSPIASMVMDAFTQIVSGSVGFHHKRNGYSQLVSVFQVFEDVGILCESGAYTSVTNSATNFGNYALKAVGFSDTAYPFYRGTLINAQNVNLDFNNTPANIIASSFASAGLNKTTVTLQVDSDKIEQFSKGQTITVAGHSVTAANGTGLTISDVINNTISYTVNVSSSGLTGGGESGTVTITQGRKVTRLTISGFTSVPLPNYIVKVKNPNITATTTFYERNDGLEYVVEEATPFDETGVTVVTLQVVWEDANLPNNTDVELRRPSTINSSSHTFEFIGSGINYTALPENGGVTDPQTQTVEVNSGRVYCSATDQDGNFTVGPFFNVDLKTGKITFTGTVSLGVIDEIQLKNSPGVPIREFSIDKDLSGDTGAANTRIPTQRAIRDFVKNKLGDLFNKTSGTSGGAGFGGQLVELTAQGFISASQLPPRSPFNIYNVANETERLNLGIPVAQGGSGLDVNPGDYVYQADTKITYILQTKPTNIANNWILLPSSGTNANTISGIIPVGNLGTGIASATTFLAGDSSYKPVVRSLVSDSEAVIVGSNSTTPAGYPADSEVGDVTVTVNTVTYSSGQTNGASSLGVAKFDFTDFNISNGVVSIKDQAVDLTEIVHISANSVLGNNSQSSGAVSSLPLNEVVATVPTISVTFSNTTYSISVNGVDLGSNPVLTLTKGQTYKFDLNVPSHGFNLTTSSGSVSGNLYSNGLKGLNGTTTTNDTTKFIWTVPLNAPNILFYQDGNSLNNFGVISLVGGFVSISTNTAKNVLTLQDNGTIVEITASSATSIGLPNNLPVGFNVIVVQKGTGRITFSPATGSTMRNSRNHTGTANQYSSVTLYVSSNNLTNNGAEYILSGDTL